MTILNPIIWNYKIIEAKKNWKWKQSLKEYKKQLAVPLKHLSQKQISEIKMFYRRYGFSNIKTDWHEYIYSTSGECSPQLIPEDFFHIVLEKAYNNSDFYSAWEDKAYMPFILKDVRFPETVFCNINGYYYDNLGKMISKDEAKSLILKNEDLFAKPTFISGGGRNAMIVKKGKYEELFDKLKKNYIVQKRIIQTNETASLNPSSVNTEKIVSFMFKGEVYILSSIMRVGAENAITDAAAGGKGYFFGINDDGTAKGYGMNVFGEKREFDFEGNPIKGKVLSHHKEIVGIIKQAHKHFPYFGFMSWDFCVDSNDEIVLIEYNTGYPVAMVYQMVNGPLLGELTETVLKDARKRINNSITRSL